MVSASPHLQPDHACLIVHGSDTPGIIAAVSALIARQGGNIVAFDQYSDDPRGGAYFQRVVFHRPDLAVALPEIEADIATTLGEGFDLEWTLTDLSTPKRMAILASKQDHCLLDLLWRHRRGDLPVSIPMVVSNHTTAAEDVRSFGVPFFHVPSTPGPTSRHPRPASSNCSSVTSTSSCSRATCRSSPPTSSRRSGCR